MKLACQLNDIFPGTGVCALLEGRQIALFRPSDAAEVFAIDNRDPFFAANVLSRGLICEHEGALWVTSPLKKQHFRLSDG
ncbi:nitrite reductase small subunit NirD, partial [Aeromonas salmonicida]|uniref:nitrite reductase small subunit NirD n=1 Tax=Aeromonas salmonicida TaxID=645 RepID=UPI001C60D178